MKQDRAKTATSGKEVIGLRRMLATVLLLALLTVVIVGVTFFMREGFEYPIYPDTDEAPVLEFLWGGAGLRPEDVVYVGPYGVWEGSGGVYENEPATEIEIHTVTSHDPVYAPCPGTVTYYTRREDGEEVVAIRYGRNYVIIQHHLRDVPENIRPGVKVERGTLLGYTETMPNGAGFWEMEMFVRRGNVFRTRPPYDYFSQESKNRLDSYLNAVLERNPGLGVTGWTVTGEGSWTKYLPAPEWWGDPYKAGYRTRDPEDLEDFLSAHGLLWVLKKSG